MDFDLMYLNRLVTEGYLNFKRDESCGLLLYDYTPKTQYDCAFKEHPILLNCRGLVLDENGYTVAYPLPKFFNIEEVEHFGLPDEQFDVYQKLDGSLGIVYFWDGKWRVNTRGSFESNQALTAKVILENKYGSAFLDRELTYLFEIIYPENRIVVNYGDTNDLILLTAFSKQGEEHISELNRLQNYYSIVQRYHFSDYKTIKSLDWDNHEGFVVRFKNGYRVKIKFDTYCKLHYILSGVNEKRIWEYLYEKVNMDELLKDVPDEYYKLIDEITSSFHKKYQEIEKNAIAYYNEVIKEISGLTIENDRLFRKTFVEINKKVVKDDSLYFGLLMSMLDKKDYSEYIWKSLKPKIESNDTLFNWNTSIR
jgi:RNA ligase